MMANLWAEERNPLETDMNLLGGLRAFPQQGTAQFAESFSFMEVGLIVRDAAAASVMLTGDYVYHKELLSPDIISGIQWAKYEKTHWTPDTT